MHIIVSGATGFLGRALLLHLASIGARVTAWVRDVPRARDLLGPDVELIATSDHDGLARAVAAADVVVHLAGESIVDGRWSAQRKQTLLDSRVTTAEHLLDAIRRRQTKLPLLLSASAVGYYGDRGNEVLSEVATAGVGFAAALCQQWEQAALTSDEWVERSACLRIGVVLGRHGGALPTLARISRMWLGGPLGRGEQWVPWIHIDDAVAAIGHVIATPTLRGPINVVSPNPVHQRELATCVGITLSRPARLPTPTAIIRLLLGEAATLVLSSQRAVPTALLRSGFAFRFTNVGSAIDDLLRNDRAVVIRRLRRGDAPRSPYLEGHTPSHVLVARTKIERPLEDIIGFFADPENLALLTPPTMSFAIKTPRPIEMAVGAVIDYRISLSGVPMTWRTVIERWQPGEMFVDAQHRGPYASWWHEHRFSRDGAHTVMDDAVYYAAPLGLLGRIVNRLFIAAMLRDIFAYRNHAVRLRFAPNKQHDRGQRPHRVEDSAPTRQTLSG